MVMLGSSAPVRRLLLPKPSTLTNTLPLTRLTASLKDPKPGASNASASSGKLEMPMPGRAISAGAPATVSGPSCPVRKHVRHAHAWTRLERVRFCVLRACFMADPPQCLFVFLEFERFVLNGITCKFCVLDGVLTS
jgi:hypothetical protein